MRRLSISPVVLITAALALLLIAYVFVPRGDSGSSLRCSSRQTLDQIKMELFRRAAAVRGTGDAAFSDVANYAVLRTNSRILRSHDKNGAVHCYGSMVLDLPPGIQVIGGRHSLGAALTYTVTADRGARGRLRKLGKADAIVQLLATAERAATEPGAVAAPASATNHATASTSQIPPKTLTPVPAGPTQATGRGAPREREPEHRRPPPTAQPRVTAAARSTLPAAAGATEPRRSLAVPPPVQSTVATRIPRPIIAGPSFNCRYARTPSEIAVCRNPDLAALDREMAAQFNRAIAIARPGPRVMLERSRNRFLRFRDSCASDACVAQAYRSRMNEISDILSGRF